MATKISNVMVENEVTKNIFFLFATPSLKNLPTSQMKKKKK